MIKLLIGITLSEIGGSQKVVYQIISNLPEDLYEISVLTAPQGAMLDWIEEINRKRDHPIEVITWSCLRREISPLQDSLALLKLIRLLRARKFDVVHFHNSKMGLIGRIAAWVSRIPKVYYTVHGWGLNPQTTGRLFQLLGLIERFLSRFTTQMVFVSRRDMEQGIQNRWATPDRSRLIYNGIDGVEGTHPLQGEAVDLRKQLKVSPQIPIIGFVARLAEPKDPLFAIHVAEELVNRGIDHRLCIIGNGPKYEACGQLIRDLDLHQQVVLMGTRGDVMSLLAQMDLFCLFSRWEGLPISVLEAMQTGLPIVASNVGGLGEMIVDGETGYLLDSSDLGKATDLVSGLLADPAARIAMGGKAKESVETKFQLSRMVLDYRDLYEQSKAPKGSKRRLQG